MENKLNISKPKIAIVGQGAIGSLIGFKCHQLCYDYEHLIKNKLNSVLTVADISGETHTFTPNCRLITNPSQFDILLLPVKAYQVMSALKQLRPFLSPHHIVVLLHNGMGTIEQVQKLLPQNPLIAATTSYGALKPQTNVLKETGQGATHLGWISFPKAPIQRLIEPILSTLLPPSHWHQEITLALWNKLAVNAVINPLTAIHNLKNGELTNKIYGLEIAQICDEIACVMNALGYEIESEQLFENVLQVASATANNYSSMHQDIKYKRQTEIDFISGYVVLKASELDIKVPHIKNMMSQIKQLQT